MNTPYNRNDYANASQPDVPIYTQRQLDLAVTKEREQCATWLKWYDGKETRRSEAVRNGDHWHGPNVASPDTSAPVT